MKNQPPGPCAGEGHRGARAAGGVAAHGRSEPGMRPRREVLSVFALAPTAVSAVSTVSAGGAVAVFTASPASAVAQSGAGELPYGPVADLAQAFEVARQMREQALARGDQGYGAVVLRDHEIVGLGASQVVTQSDPTAHAEMNAIRDAARRLGTRNLSECTLVSTSRPCRMCETAAYWARVGEMIAGSAGQAGVAPAYCDH